jgi:3-deoxy-D-manno-octulosonate 8-phosphate phosphatase KdsC-like HAD superfamily phosphatase
MVSKGDDIVDSPVLRRVGLVIAVRNVLEDVRTLARIIKITVSFTLKTVETD